MDAGDSRTLELLLELKQRNEVDAERGEQRLYPAEQGAEICTLDAVIRRPLSPMLQARFSFCGRWENARLSQDWLGLDEIAAGVGNIAIREALALRFENWDFVPPATIPRQNCAIFALNSYDGDETYFEWREDRAEPLVWTFFDAEVSAFFDFNRYLEYALGERDNDDTDGSGNLVDFDRE